MRINIIMATGPGGLIGAEGRLPWLIPQDLNRFRELTMGHAVVMGRDTYRSLGMLRLPGRDNVVISRRPVSTVGLMHFTSLDKGIEWCRLKGNSQCFLIGGVKIFQHGFKVADRMYITQVESKHVRPHAPTKLRYMKLPEEGWSLTESEKADGITYEIWDRV